MITTINQNQISQIAAHVAGGQISFMYNLNDVVQYPETLPVQVMHDFIADNNLNYFEEFKKHMHIPTYLIDHKIEVVRLWLIERYK